MYDGDRRPYNLVYNVYRSESRLADNYDTMSFDLQASGKRALCTGVSGAVIGAVAYGVGGSGNLPIVGSQVPAPIAFGAATAIGSVVADGALAITAGTQLGQNATAKMVVGLGVSGYIGGMMLADTGADQGASFYENAGVAALSYYVGDYGCKSYYNVPGQLC